VRNYPQSVIHHRTEDNQHYKLFYRYEDASYELYNLSEDIGEKTNLLGGNPTQKTLDLAIEMNNKLRDWLMNRKAPTGTWLESGEPVNYPPLNMKESDTTSSKAPNYSRSSRISIYPNPAKDFISVKDMHQDGRIRIVDMSGKTILCIPIDKNPSTIMLKDIKKGTYLLQITQSNNVSSFKLVKV
jgi:hypothetical protein